MIMERGLFLRILMQQIVVDVARASQYKEALIIFYFSTVMKNKYYKGIKELNRKKL
jgi:hypothetical protein